jgi:hypothetical protein
LKSIKSDKNNIKHPSIKVDHYNGPATLYIFCVEANDEFSMHPHLVTGNGNTKGFLFKKDIDIISGSPIDLEFGILSTKRAHVSPILKLQKEMLKGSFPQFSYRCFDNSKHAYNFNMVKLCFQVVLRNGESSSTPSQKALHPVFSRPIRNVTKVEKELKIVTLSDDCASFDGGKKIMMFSETVVRKKFIEIHFSYMDVQENKMKVIKVKDVNVYKDFGISFESPLFPSSNQNRVCDNIIHSSLYVCHQDGRQSGKYDFYFLPTSKCPEIDSASKLRAKKSSSINTRNTACK